MIRAILRAARTAVFVAATSTLLAGCGFLSSSSMVAPTTMTISSQAVAQNILPSDFTCHAANPVTPPLAWFGAPSGTQSYALVVDDSSAPITPFIYWIVFDIRPTTTDIQQGHLPPGAKQALNSAGTATYDPPCPQGSSHSYRFTIYALNKTLSLPNGTSLESAWTAIAAATIGRGRMQPATGNP
jgi:Raf kinase inhibitor-like YbhB/YbcL family protein